MKSALLAGKLRELLGGEGEGELRRLVEEARADHPELAGAALRLLETADDLVWRLVARHQIQLELSGDAFSDWNLKAGRIESGRQWKTLLGFGEEELGDTLADWRYRVHPDDFAAFNAAIAEHLKRRSAFFQTECRMMNKSGGWTRILLKGKAVAREADGQILRLLLLQRDVSAFRQAEAAALEARDAAEAASRARSHFLANMSHEIRTPMNGIIGMTDLVLDTRLDAEQRHYLRTVKSSAESLLAIVNDILDFSKIESGKMRFESVPFSMSNLVFEAVRTQAVEAHRKGLEVVVSFAPEVPQRVVGDPTRLRQVIANLVGNAVKFTERGEIEVVVAVDERTAAGVTLRFLVRDTGIGIPASRQAAVFEAFSQADDSTTRRFGGTGLGLAICHHLVQLMGGRIWLESVEGQGSRFFFTAALRAVETEEAAAAEAPFAETRALVFSANRTLTVQLNELLNRLGVRVSHFADAVGGVAAVGRARTLGFPYDFVLVDAAMPAPSGIALAEAWQGERHTEKLIMLLDTEQQRQELKRLRDLGIDAHLVKPIAPEDLIQALTMVCRRAEEGETFLEPFDVSVRAAKGAAPPVEILVVEDNPVNQEVAERLLKKRGFRVTLANNGAEALECFERHHFDIILMDMQMPVMDGIEATESIRSREMRRSWVISDEFRQAHIIAMTANAMEGDRERCLRAGMNDYISKPVKPEELYAAIERALEHLGKPGIDVGAQDFSRPLTDTSLDLEAAARDLGDRDLLHTMAGMLVGEWDTHIANLKTNLAARNGEQLRLSAHTLKSLLAIFHAETSRRLALELEQAAYDTGADWPHCAMLCGLLLDELARLRPEMERFSGIGR